MSETNVTVDLPKDLDPTLNELFSSNPLEWTDDNCLQVVKHLRETRAIFAKEDSQAKTKGRRVNPQKALASGGTTNLTLGDLDLGL